MSLLWPFPCRLGKAPNSGCSFSPKSLPPATASGPGFFCLPHWSPRASGGLGPLVLHRSLISGLPTQAYLAQFKTKQNKSNTQSELCWECYSTQVSFITIILGKNTLKPPNNKQTLILSDPGYCSGLLAVSSLSLSTPNPRPAPLPPMHSLWQSFPNCRLGHVTL